MSVTETRINLLDLDEVRLREFFQSIGEKPFRAEQILKWIYHQGVTDFELMTNLSKELRQRLERVAVVEPPKVLSEQVSLDGTTKWLIGFGGGNAVETVFIPETSRGTLCISSQVGCALNCTFCATGAQGFNRNLTTAEIIGQVWLAARALGHERNGIRRITNVVLMGMGEPLLNFDAVVPALSLLRHDLGFGFAAKRVTLSTAGLVPGIDRLRETIDVALAVSLHAPEDALRETLVPLNRKYPIRELMRSCADYVSDKHKRTVTFEYTLIDGVNDHPEHARQLVKLLRRLPSKLNLIPFNPFPGTRYRCSTAERIREFQEIVMAGGLIATVRKTRGDDIDAACGQLAGKVLDRTRRSQMLRQHMQRN
ncbi:MAG: 23S rRNA (adenine(2503)-C(2))-methyltransferase RlmN [Xanthomonadales bacterium]|jgi:23S rRNA (adenine2503-C2)-methyltransferase|nr:23S rRNA (adenine(2503)-C(2))-methyltransferase RlmN [Xanthomonadales bacterium]MDH3924125.1 23S rRNA (adenine(2503)-C(2))-methyltransferase RlmN [Xanthomonadales bacterium]MDH3942132.1 23S rRNA (adenine(2503)-C(2))-methyltransferase RlmN [Xanthomonadales bacterium]MDH4000063.1 23S rRNA (adenine(2503)-C(2))-methyltransferase RlmN [Xanthomonadales bacterium]